jgi:hypothetical protein
MRCKRMGSWWEYTYAGYQWRYYETCWVGGINRSIWEVSWPASKRYADREKMRLARPPQIIEDTHNAYSALTEGVKSGGSEDV